MTSYFLEVLSAAILGGGRAAAKVEHARLLIMLCSSNPLRTSIPGENISRILKDAMKSVFVIS